MKYYMKTIKKILVGILCILCLVGCGEKKEPVESTSQAIPKTTILQGLGTKLIEAGIFEGEIAEVNKKMVTEAYKLENDTVISSYMSTASKADELTIIQTKDISKANNLAKAYLADREKVFESYAPEEVTKLQQALVRSYGQDEGICIICVSGKSKDAEELIQNNVK